MKQKDWIDDAWNEFAERFDIDESNTEGLRLLKEAWLDGARIGVGHAEELVKESADKLKEEFRA